jgi:hypothetical protein
MDLLSKRYANPCFFLNGMIQTGRFAEFVDEFVQTINEEREEQNNWEFFLHRVWDRSFSDFKHDIEINKQNKGLSKGTIETTIQHSMNILNNFNPNEGGE